MTERLAGRQKQSQPKSPVRRSARRRRYRIVAPTMSPTHGLAVASSIRLLAGSGGGHFADAAEADQHSRHEKRLTGMLVARCIDEFNAPIAKTFGSAILVRAATNLSKSLTPISTRVIVPFPGHISQHLPPAAPNTNSAINCKLHRIAVPTRGPSGRRFPLVFATHLRCSRQDGARLFSGCPIRRGASGSASTSCSWPSDQAPSSSSYRRTDRL